MKTDKLKIKIDAASSVTALLYLAARSERQGITLILGHGAGADQLSSFMVLFANGLAARGLDVMTFNFLYKEQGRGIPDPKPKLESCYRAVIDAAIKHKTLKGNRLAIGGKSMGGRIGSQVVAADPDPGVSALVFLGYPLHPPGRPDKPRSEHLKSIRATMLFVQGARDAFGNQDEIKSVIKTLRLKATLYAVEGGDHSLKVPKSSSTPQPQVYEAAMDEIVGWLTGK